MFRFDWLVLVFFLLTITGCSLTSWSVNEICQDIPYQVQEEFVVDELYNEMECDKNVCKEVIKHNPVTELRTITKYKTVCE